MSNALIAWIVAIGLGATAVGLGLRRNLGNTTRNWLPTFEGREPAMATPMSSAAKREPSPRQVEFAIGAALLIGLSNAVLAVISEESLWRAAFAVLWLAIAGVQLRRYRAMTSGT